MRSLLARFGHWLGRAALAVLPPIVALGLCAAAIWNTIHGERGTLAQEAKRQEIAEAQARLDQLNAERQALENKVNSLRGDTLDLDLLDERARRMLNQFGRDELVVPYEPTQRLQ
jgi:cell division protein FtsB